MVISGNFNIIPTQAGIKARKLSELTVANFRVPSFVVIPVNLIKTLVAEEDDLLRNKILSETKDEAAAILQTKLYAVRSATLIEDGEKNSQAGQFLTRLRVQGSDLPVAIWQVIADSLTKVSSDKISVIVQEFIEADYAGVIFSRNPLGEREMVLEYNKGIGESVVGGQSVQQVKFLCEQVNLQPDMPKFANQLAKLAMAIETKYDCPQDIEWAVKDGLVYILQSRPITSITSGQWEGIKFLETFLRDKNDYYYEQTDITETFDKPKPLAFSIVKSLYSPQGPIRNSYRKLYLKYTSVDQLQLFGNELYVDKAAELKSIFPALGYYKYRSVKPRFEHFSKVIITVWNWLCLSLMSNKVKVSLQMTVLKLLEDKWSESISIRERWVFILKQYELIFEINIRAQKSIHTLERLLGKDTHHMVSILNNSVEDNQQIADYQSLVGNSFNIDDNSPFLSGYGDVKKVDDKNKLEAWLKTLPSWRRQGLLPYIEQAQRYNSLREQARILAVKLISYLRRAVVEIGKEKFSDDPELIYFSTMEELVTGSISKELCLQRKEKYLVQQNLVLPRTISSFLIEHTSNCNVGISSGIGKGVLVTQDLMESTTGPKILYTKILSPNLVKYFNQIEGIVSQEGGLLSHLAIMARESGIPVVVTNQILEPLMMVEINGSTGEILKA
ncbi:MAG: hypothetical protein RLZZ230_150 [Candidatus Parcubacteria bacterium]|jgi:phosphohistidine swiveling domain-containing protein